MEVLVGIGTSAATSVFNGMLFAYMPAFLVRSLHYDVKARVAGPERRGLPSPRSGWSVWPGSATACRAASSSASAPACWFSSAFRSSAALIDRSVGLVPLFILAGLVAALINGTFAMVLADLFPDPGAIQRCRSGV